jgi:hypothetical protein
MQTIEATRLVTIYFQKGWWVDIGFILFYLFILVGSLFSGVGHPAVHLSVR